MLHVNQPADKLLQGAPSEEDESLHEARATWESLVGGSKLARQACTCQLIPCLCGDAPSGESDWVATTCPPTARRRVEEGLVLNSGETGAKQRCLDLRLSRVLKPHQVSGVQYLCARALESSGGRGCILADVMGLGKTLQLISVLWAYLADNDTNTALVVAPAFVLPNWMAEITRWLPGDVTLRSRCLPASGSRHARVAAIAKWHTEGGTLLIGYEMFRQLVTTAAEKGSADDAIVLEALCDPGPGLAVLDEAHRLKEPKSLLYKALKRIRTCRRVLVSGYPVQNRLDEYYALVDFARPGALGTYDTFKDFFERPIASYVEACENDANADEAPTDSSRLALRRAFALHDSLRDVVLRRDIDELGTELPPRRDWVIHCELSPTQAALYAAFEASTASSPSSEQRESTSTATNSLGELASYHTALAIVNHPDIIHTALADEERLFEEATEDTGAEGDKRTKLGDDQWQAPEIVESERKATEERRARNEARLAKLRQKLAARIMSSVAKAAQATCDDDAGEDRLEVAVLSIGDLSRWARPVLRPLAKDPSASSGYVTAQADGRCGSGKAAVALALISAITAKGERAVLFSQTLGTLDVLERLLNNQNKRAKPIRYRRIDGATAAARRNAIVDRFNRDGVISTASNAISSASRRRAFAPVRKSAKSTAATSSKSTTQSSSCEEACDVLLMSIKAGGEGINLTGASRVIL